MGSVKYIILMGLSLPVFILLLKILVPYFSDFCYLINIYISFVLFKYADINSLNIYLLKRFKINALNPKAYVRISIPQKKKFKKRIGLHLKKEYLVGSGCWLMPIISHQGLTWKARRVDGLEQKARPFWFFRRVVPT